ncbi:hypothetical protein BJX63DRAFT_410664 [Aspergillus granulosus]|uniref:Protein kinase domain-containing protein n=1 Tax=Aspergillus granulosus TaxID=176169 RepID=A0ABR4GZH7_9EURO
MSSQAKVVARKCFRTKASYDREEGVLKLLSGCRRQHTHILGPLAMISLQGDFSILMEVADCNLGKLLSKDGKMSDNISLASLLGQVEGLADALSFLHDSKMGTGATIYHKDVKADNVLIMRPTGSDDIGHWMLSDFDVSNYYQTDPGRGPPGSAYGWTKVFTFQGRQDEHLAPDNGYGYGPYSDVWSLGCILTRVVCRKSLGTKGLEAFERSLSMGDPENNGYFYRGNAINPNVEDMLNDFCTSSCEMTKACGVLLKSVLCMDRHKRPTAKAFQEKLYQIREQKTHLIVGPADWLQIPLSQPEIFSDTTEWFLPSLSSFQSPQNEPLPLEGSPKPHQPHVPPQIRFPDQSSPSDTESDYQGSSQRQSSEATLELQAPEVPLDKVESPRNDATNSVRIAIEQTVEDTAMSLLKDLFSGTITTYSDLSQYSAGLTALCHAAQKGYTRVVEFLIDKGAHVDEPDGRKTTPLMYACREGHSSTAESLIDKGANWNLKGEDEYTCLHFATETRKIEILELFQRKRPGAPRPLDANQLNKFDRTPLELHFHRKAEHDRYELIRPLLALGAEPKVSSQDPKHQTAVDLVIHEDDRKAMNILLMEDPTLKVSKSGMKQSGIKLSRDMNKLLTKYDRLEP